MKYTLLALLSITLISCKSKPVNLAAQDADFEAYVRASLVEDIETLKAQQEMGFAIELLDVNNYRVWEEGVYAADSTFKIVFKGKPFVFTVTNLFNLTEDLKVDYDTIVTEDESYAKYEEDVNRFMLQVTFNLI